MKAFRQPVFSWKHPRLYQKFVVSQKTTKQKVYFWSSWFSLVALLDFLLVLVLVIVVWVVTGRLTRSFFVIFLGVYVAIFALFSIGQFLKYTLPSTVYVFETGIRLSRGLELAFSDIRDFFIVPVIFQDEQVISIVLNTHNHEQYLVEVSDSVSEHALREFLAEKITYVPENREIILK